MNFADFLYYWDRLKEDPGRLLKLVTSKNARGILLHSFTEPNLYKFLTAAVNRPASEIKSYVDELENVKLLPQIKERYCLVRGRKLISHQNWHNLIYLLIRLQKPQFVVETGVFDGLSSSFILLALSKNKKGTLYSIDLPAVRNYLLSTGEMLEKTLPKGKIPGWIVPANLRKRWRLLLGSSREHLPKILKRVGRIDFFVHDSLHTYDYMIWEYQTAWKKIKKGGFLCSDDVYLNQAFADFSRSIGKNSLIKSSFGVIVK